MDNFYSKTSKEVMDHFKVSNNGLTNTQYEKLLNQYGYNELTEKKKKGVLIVFLEQFKDLLVGILIVAGIISAVTGNLESTLVIFAVILLNAILGTVQHFKAEKSLSSSKALSSPTAKVIRNGEKFEVYILSSLLVNPSKLFSL